MSKRNRRSSAAPEQEQTAPETQVETPVTEEPTAPAVETEVSEPTAPAQEAPEKPVVNKPVEKTATTKRVVLTMGTKQTSTKSAEKTVDPAVVKFNELADKYISLMSSAVITDEIRKQAIGTLAGLANAVIMTNNVAVFEACFKFMLKNRAIMLTPETVVDGINRFLPKDKITRVVQFYVTFQALVESKIMNTKFVLNVTTIRRIFNNSALANWLLAKR